MKRVLKKIYAILAFISFLMIIGTVGASERDTISFTQFIIWEIISLICLVIFIKLAGGFELDYTEELYEDFTENQIYMEEPQQKSS